MDDALAAHAVGLRLVVAARAECRDRGARGRQPEGLLRHLVLEAATADAPDALALIEHEHARADAAIGRALDAHDRGEHGLPALRAGLGPLPNDRLTLAHGWTITRSAER